MTCDNILTELNTAIQSSAYIQEIVESFKKDISVLNKLYNDINQNDDKQYQDYLKTVDNHYKKYTTKEQALFVLLFVDSKILNETFDGSQDSPKLILQTALVEKNS